MSFNNILAQDNIVNYLKRAITNKHLTHAYIFTGQEGLGKSLCAKEFIKSLICRKTESGHCDICHDCVRIDGLNHPDIHWEILDKKAKFIRIERIRDIQHRVNLSSVESDYKVFVIKDAERMTEEASNCLLKTIEEPPKNTLFLLITNSLPGIKETIISRCQVIRFKPIHKQLIKEYLMEKFTSSKEEIEWAADYCCGSIGKACTLLRDGFFQKNIDVINRISGLTTEQNLDCAENLVKDALTHAGTLEEGRKTLRNTLNCLLRYYRDMLILKISKRDNKDTAGLPIFNTNQAEALKVHSAHYSREKIMKTIDEIFLSFEYLDCNANIHLLIENLVTRISAVSKQR
ncbi:MAG: DNA polymerase III subunit delta' [Planctomycetes bacterium]|nr:DNA polymerase III subunit delta' [Planctomycetota bacterium]